MTEKKTIDAFEMTATSEDMNARPFAATVDLGAVEDNVRYLKGLTPGGCLFMAVVKADGYGHGDVEVSAAALRAGADRLGVAMLEEGARLRGAGFTCPIHLIFEPPPSAAGAVVDDRLIATVYSEEYARALSAAAMARGCDVAVHIKVDTGMHRVGIDPDRVFEFVSLVAELPAVNIEGVYTHFACAHDPADGFTSLQIRRFEEAARAAEETLGRPLLKHAANSAAVMAFPESHYSMVRVGIAMYGLPPSKTVPGIERLEPALTLAGRVASVKKVPAGEGISYGLVYAPPRDTFVAVIPAGYADGVSRILTGKGEVLIGGTRRPMLGRVCMDAFMADLGPEPVEAGEPVVLIGAQGDEEITADDVADELGTINYEVTCMISRRVPRVYLDHSGGRA